MWRTQYGERTLEGAEAKVFAEALLNLLDEVTLCDFDDYELGMKNKIIIYRATCLWSCLRL